MSVNDFGTKLDQTHLYAMRWLWNLGGFASLGTGIVGIYVPGLPTTVFFIMALFCFTKGGNEKWRQWLLNRPVFGPILRDWEAEKSIPLWVKWVSCSCIVGFGGFSVFIVHNLWVKGIIAAVCLAGIAYIVTRKTKVVGSAVVDEVEAIVSETDVAAKV